MKDLLQALRMLAVLTVLTGIAYPLAVTAVARVLFPRQAGGSLLWRAGQPVGSELLGQSFASDRYVWPRPSVGNYAALPSAASNLPPSSRDLVAAVAARVAALRQAYGVGPDTPLPGELLHASASGLDPHLSPAAARLQAPRVAQARGLAIEEVERLMAQCTEGPQLGFLGEPRVNVLRLNLALDGR